MYLNNFYSFGITILDPYFREPFGKEKEERALHQHHFDDGAMPCFFTVDLSLIIMFSLSQAINVKNIDKQYCYSV